jgi:O-antigen/teichoic acid export membrane protein
VIGGLILMALAGALVSREAVMILAPDTYLGAIAIVPWVILAYFLNGLYICYVNILFYFKQTKILPLITGTAAIINILMNLWLVPRFGIIAAAWNTVLAYFISSFLTIWASRRILHLPVEWPRLLSMAMLALIAFFAFQWLETPNVGLSLLYKGVAYVTFVAILFRLRLLPREALMRLPLVGRVFTKVL